MLGGGYHWTFRDGEGLLQLRYGTVATVRLRLDGQYDVVVKSHRNGIPVELRGRSPTLRMAVRHIERCIQARERYPYKRYLAQVDAGGFRGGGGLTY